ncbi:MAG: hypothetical protein Roseis3KO_36030 [Roseivirga sp.]
MNKFDKALKVLWFVNGIIILVLVSIATYRLISELFPKPYERVVNDIIVGERLEEAKEKGLALQGLVYRQPEVIYNSTDQYIEVSAKTYEEAKVLALGFSSAGDYSPALYGAMNVIFINKDYEVIRTLLKRKADIREWKFARPDNGNKKEPDLSVQNIAYEIAFEDTNRDGLLNDKDHHELYISGLTGENLTQVTTGLDVDSFDFENKNSQLFITYFERTDERQEHKRKKFAIYTIATKEFRKLEDLDKTINKLESQLVN